MFTKHTNDLKEEDLSLDINRSKVRFREKLNIEPIYFSYPFGEYTPDYISAVSNKAFKRPLPSSMLSAHPPKRSSSPLYNDRDFFRC